MNRQKYIVFFLCFLWMVNSCTDAYIPEVQHPENESGKVAVELHTVSADYTFPTTRANETLVGSPMILLFTGTNMNAVFSEAAQSIYDGTATKVILTETSSPCIAMVITNMPGNKFFNGTTEVDFTVENLTATLTGKTISQIEREGLLRTERLISPVQTIPPFSTSTSALPMSGIIHLNSGINPGISIGTAQSEVSLTRAVSKTIVKVDPTFTGDFTMEWIGVCNAPQNGNLYRTEATLYTTGLTHYLQSATGDGVTGMIPVTNNTNTTNPIYLYESKATSNTALLIKATFEGQSYYYKLPYYERETETRLDIYRNKQYVFTITHVEEGYSTMEDALNSMVSVLGYDVTVDDDYSFEITTNGYYYLGLTNSRIEIFDPNTITLTEAFTMVTDAWTGLGVTTATLTPEGGITVTPTVITLPTIAETTVTPVTVSMPAAVQSATIKITIGNFYKTITIIRHNYMSGGRMLLPYDDYFSCEILNRGTGAWLGVSNGKSISYEGFILPVPGRIYLTSLPTTSGIHTGGELYTVRDPQGAPLQRTKIFVSQIYN